MSNSKWEVSTIQKMKHHPISRLYWLACLARMPKEFVKRPRPHTATCVPPGRSDISSVCRRRPLACTVPNLLDQAAHLAILLITSAVLILSPKSVTVPSQSVTWLGKIISHGHPIPLLVLHAHLATCDLPGAITFLAVPLRTWWVFFSGWALPLHFMRLSLRHHIASSTSHSYHLWFSLLVASLGSTIPLMCRPLPPPLCIPPVSYTHLTLPTKRIV